MIGSFLGSGAAFLTVGFAAAFGLVLAIIVAHVSTRISLETGPLLTAGAIASVLALHS